MSKLLEERVPLRALFISPSGARMYLAGFVDSKTASNGLGISASGPPIDVKQGFLNMRPFDRNCEFWYGEKRELTDEEREGISGPDEESALTIRFLDFGEKLFLFFTI